jgi:hypothetical protein
MFTILIRNYGIKLHKITSSALLSRKVGKRALSERCFDLAGFYIGSDRVRQAVADAAEPQS